ncbi:MAG TPA: GAF domain-containing protein, partial [Spirochaetia bacterium]|nr:GAF domain-containing protein [Spirochaetia bacterium]
MSKLVLRVAEGVPELPAAVQKDKTLAVRRVKRMSGALTNGGDLVAWLVDSGFLEKNGKALGDSAPASGSVLLWNPGGKAPAPEGSLPEDLLYEEVFSFTRPADFQRTLRNLFHRLYLERQLEEKDRLLKAKESENSELLQVGIALSAERDNDKLLAYILRQLRQITRADAGTLYLLERDEAGKAQLLFKIAQNDSNPRDYTEFRTPLDKKKISGYVAATGSMLNIEDAYKIPPDREYSFSDSFDKQTGYLSRSMLTVPMQDHKGEILGVIQLINRKIDFSLKISAPEEVERVVVPFPKDIEQLVLSLASQAAVSLENNKLYQEIETLFEGFVNASVTAIESRDPTTSGHSRRVAEYTVGLAKAATRADFGAYRGINFTPEQLKEIRYASLLHDFGKVGVREYVLVKEKKLYPDQYELVKMRLAYIRKAKLYELMRQRFSAIQKEGPEGYLRLKEEIDRQEQEFLKEMDRYVETIHTANIPTVLPSEPSPLLKEIRYASLLHDFG